MTDRVTVELVEEPGSSRADVLRIVGVALLGGALALGGAGIATGAPSKAQDVEILRFALVVEQLNAAFYGQAFRGGALRGDTRGFARIVARDERGHVRAVAAQLRRLGATPAPPPEFDFKDTTEDQRRFQMNALALETSCVAALNGAGPLLPKPTLAAAAGLVSVEARHEAWIRDITGGVPAPRAVDRDGALEEGLARTEGDTRERFLRRAAVAGGGLAGGGALLGLLATGASAQSGTDVAILNFALTLEELEAAF